MSTLSPTVHRSLLVAFNIKKNNFLVLLLPTAAMNC